MDPSNFDEFGNYIGPELSGSDDVRHLGRPQGLSLAFQPILP